MIISVISLYFCSAYLALASLQSYTRSGVPFRQAGGYGFNRGFQPKRRFNSNYAGNNNRAQSGRDFRFKAAATEDFLDLVTNNYAFVDKSLLISELLSAKAGGKVISITQPRGFGKTVNMDMLRRFLQIEVDENGTPLPEHSKVNGKLFVGGRINTVNVVGNRTYTRPKTLRPLQIVDDSKTMKYRGNFPVVSVSFKDVIAGTFEDFEQAITSKFDRLYAGYSYLKKSVKKEDYQRENETRAIATGAGTKTAIRPEYRLLVLCRLLHSHYKRKVFLLIDEYDTPIMNGYFAATASGRNETLLEFSKIFDFYRSVLVNALKDNQYLARAVLTGLIPITSDLNLDGVAVNYDAFDKKYSKFFGFESGEIQYLLKVGKLSTGNGIDGWHRSGTVYTPWSLMRCLQNRGKNGPYWVDEREKWFVKQALLSDSVQQDVQQLLTADKKNASITFARASSIFANGSVSYPNRDFLLSTLAFSGYLMTDSKSNQFNAMTIPNSEVKFIYTNAMLRWLYAKLKISSSAFFSLVGLLNNSTNVDKFSARFGKMLNSTPAFPHYQQSLFYKNFMLSLRYVLSLSFTNVNKLYSAEPGSVLVFLPPKDSKKNGDHALVITYALADDNNNDKDNDNDGKKLQLLSAEKLKEITDKRYQAKLRSLGADRALQISMAFYKQNVAIQSKEDKLS